MKSCPYDSRLCTGNPIHSHRFSLGGLGHAKYEAREVAEHYDNVLELERRPVGMS